MKSLSQLQTWIWIAMGMVAAVLAGCAVGPDYHEPKIKMAGHFGEISGSNVRSNSVSQETENAPPEQWWSAFNDPMLDHLIAEALHANFDLRIAAVRIRQARYQRSVIAADLFPNVDADAGYFRGRGSKNVVLPLGGGSSSSGGSSGAGGGGSSSSRAAKNSGASASESSGDSDSSSTGGAASGGAAKQEGVNPFSNQLSPLGKGGLPGATTSLYQIGFDSTWELDIFGGNRRRLEAAAADLSAAVENLHDVTVTLLAEVARNYLEMRGTQLRLSIARTNLAAQNELLELTRSRATAGLSSRADVTRAAAQVAMTSATIPPLEANLRRSIHVISTLLGKEPMTLNQELSEMKSLPPIPPEVPVGLPSDLLKHRPDIRAAERRIAAATARVGAAEADLFPKFALTGGIGLDSTSVDDLFDWQSHYFLVSPTATWRVFDAGRIIPNIALKKAGRQESLLQYQQTILNALHEVEDALVAYASEQAHRAALAEAFAQSHLSLELIRDQYKHGLTDFMNVLDVQRNVLMAQDQLAQSDEALATDLVAIYKALGGGWKIQK